MKKLALFAAACLAVGHGRAQDARPPDSGAVFRTGAQEVDLDLVVRDSRGRIVRNLKPEELEIYENGVRQQIKSFRMVSGREGGEPTEEAKSPTRAVTAAGPRPSALAAVNYVCLVFHNIDEHTMKYALDAAQEFLNREMRPGTGVALFSLGARLHMLHGFTTDRKQLMKLAAGAFGGSAGGVMKVSEAAISVTPYQANVSVAADGTAVLEVSGGEINPRAITGADVGTDQGQAMQRALSFDQQRAFGDIAGMQAWDQMNAMIDELGPLSGRKSVVLLSTGLATTGDRDLFQKLVDRANKAQISIYAVDVNGMMQNSATLASSAQLGHVAGLSRSQTRISGSAGEAAEKSRQGDYINMTVRTSNTQEALRALAESTGGFLIANTEDLRKPFQHVMDDINTHYEAVYAPTAAVYDGRYRKIEVKLARAGLNVQSRTGYYAIPALGAAQDLTLYDMIGLAALNAGTAPHAFDFRAGMFQFRPVAAGSQHLLALELPAAGLTATEMPGNRRRLHVSVLALIKDAAGQVVDKFSEDKPYFVPGAQFETMRKTSIPFRHSVALPPGHYTVEAAIADREVDRVSVHRFPFDSREESGLGLSSVALVEEVETAPTAANDQDPFRIGGSRRVVPDLRGTVGADAHPLAYFVVYPEKGNNAKPTVRVELLAGGKVVGDQSADLPAPDPSGRIPMVLKTAVHPGECELRVTASQGAEAVTQTLRYTVSSK